MIVSDALIVGESWISEYYFTSDATSQSFTARVLERRKVWESESADSRPTARSRFSQQRQELEVAFGGLGELVAPDVPTRNLSAVRERAGAIHQIVLDILELGPARRPKSQSPSDDQSIPVGDVQRSEHGLMLQRNSALIWVSQSGMTDRAPLAVVLAAPCAELDDVLAKAPRAAEVGAEAANASLFEPMRLEDDGPELTSAARLTSALFVADDAPDLVLILSGRWAVLAERDRWAEGRYLAVDLQLVCERNDTKRAGEIDRALTCLEAASIAPDGDGNLWWTGVLEESVKHTVGVSQDLRTGVRASIEIIGNEVVSRRAERGLSPLPADAAQPLAKQALRFLYRILFLLYAEASPELAVLPAGTPEYDRGYSLDRLRELVQVPLISQHARTGTHLYASLDLLFALVDGRTGAKAPAGELVGEPIVDTGTDEDGGGIAPGLEFNPLRADLFRPAATALIDEVQLGNHALQDVLAHLLLTKEKRGRDRGFITYAQLGINQLGKVYEGLMSYTGFFAETDLFEVAKGGDASKGSWVVPTDRIDGISSADFVTAPDPHSGELQPVLHPRGSFVFRLAGRERQQSASYYTAEVLTQFTVAQALEELLDQDGETTSAADMLNLTVCEPALGSGAFAIEAVRQLAAQYLHRRQKELGVAIDPDDYPIQLQRVKAYLALHNVYGVDLNATAVELAEISLWLDTMVAGLAAPWFGLRLRRGNSLIGARRAVFTRSQVATKTWLTAIPKDVPLASLAADVEANHDGDAGGIHHFLLPATGWGSSVEAKEATTLAADATKTLKNWRSVIRAKFTKTQVDALVELSHRVEALWRISLLRLRIAESESRRSIPVWGADALPVGGTVQRVEIERVLADPNSAYQRLRRVMDAWCALWFWPLTSAATTVTGSDGSSVPAQPPSLDQWIAGLRALLGRSVEHSGGRSRPTGPTLASSIGWDALNYAELVDLQFAGALPTERVLAEHAWLQVCETVAKRQGFFHWELDFATVFAEHGGFDLQLGNPPWVRPRSDVDALLAEGDPWWALTNKPSETLIATKRKETLSMPGITDLVVDGTAEVASLAAYLGSGAQYPHLAGLQPDLYRCFMEQTWRHGSPIGTVGLIHPETHFTDEKAGKLREATYLRLRRHWQFVNEQQLFEVDHHVSYGVHAYGRPRTQPRFRMATSLYHPETVARSAEHDGSGIEPGLKDADGNWDLRPHRDRIIIIDDDTLSTWHSILESDDVPIRQSRMVYAVNQSAAAVLDKLSRSRRIGELDLRFSPGWHEKNDRTKGYFESAWGVPESWDDVILQGPHLFVATPMYKAPNKTMLHNQDWTATDFEALAADAVPVTAYKPAGDRYAYECAYTDWGTEDEPKTARDYYRVAWRAMAANKNERTLIPALIPPGSSHVHTVTSLGSPNLSSRTLALLSGFMSSLVLDFCIRVAPKSAITSSTITRLPLRESLLEASVQLRALRLNAAATAYSALWESAWSDGFSIDQWAGGISYVGRTELGDVDGIWAPATPLRRASDRRQALLEIDALVALALDLTADELCTIYRTQFPVLYGYDRNRDFYDINGRLVPNSVLTMWRQRGDRISVDERTATNQAGNTYTYELPFVTLDREADMRLAYSEFERRLAERT